MKKRFRLLILAFMILLLAATIGQWLPPLLAFTKANSDVIQGLEALFGIGMGLGSLVIGFLGLRPGPHAPAAPPPPVQTVGGDGVERNQNKFEQTGDIHHSTVTVGNGNTVNSPTTIHITESKPATDPNALKTAYLSHLFESADILQLSGIDPKAATSEKSANLRLAAVYTALLTQSYDQEEKLGKSISAEQVERKPSLSAV